MQGDLGISYRIIGMKRLSGRDKVYPAGKHRNFAVRIRVYGGGFPEHENP